MLGKNRASSVQALCPLPGSANAGVRGPVVGRRGAARPVDRALEGVGLFPLRVQGSLCPPERVVVGGPPKSGEHQLFPWNKWQKWSCPPGSPLTAPFSSSSPSLAGGSPGQLGEAAHHVPEIPRLRVGFSSLDRGRRPPRYFSHGRRYSSACSTPHLFRYQW